MIPTIVDSQGLADLLDVPVNTVHYWRSRGTGPKGARIGKKVVYRMDAVEEWLDQRTAEDEMNTRPNVRQRR